MPRRKGPKANPMQRSESTSRPDGVASRADRRALTESVAYALWEERKRRDLPEDPEADWYDAEALINGIAEPPSA